MEFKATLHVLLTGQQKQKDGEAEPATLREQQFLLSPPKSPGTQWNKPQKGWVCAVQVASATVKLICS